jgi:hypothetical protein
MNGFCECGCGQQTRLAPCTDSSKGWTRGKPLRYINGHQHKSPPRYSVKDMGYATPCWVWEGATHRGYAVKAEDGQRVKQHRKFYEQKHGPIPKGLEPDHLCKVKACVNPDHIEPVTHTENVRRGSRTILDMQKAREIRHAVSQGESYPQVARRFGVHRNTIRMIALGLQWRES